MKAAGRGLTASRERFSSRRGLVVFQVALSLVLVASAFFLLVVLTNFPLWMPDSIKITCSYRVLVLIV